jgi:hypothetical protein
MLLCAAFVFLSGLKIISTVYGYHMSSKHTERTPENHSGMQSLLKLTTCIHILMTSGVYYFLEYHIQQFEGQMDAEMDAEVKAFVDFIQKIVIAQCIAFGLYHYLMKSLKNKEEQGAMVVDTHAASMTTKH